MGSFCDFGCVRPCHIQAANHVKFLGEKLDSGFHIGALLSGEGLGPEKVVTNISENKSQSSVIRILVLQGLIKES